jgi:hypothetical protein
MLEMNTKKQNHGTSERVALSAKVSEEAAHGWRIFCSGNGISLSAMLEVAGLELTAETIPPTEKARQRMILMAREVDRMRRVRKRD